MILDFKHFDKSVSKESILSIKWVEATLYCVEILLLTWESSM